MKRRVMVSITALMLLLPLFMPARDTERSSAAELKAPDLMQAGSNETGALQADTEQADADSLLSLVLEKDGSFRYLDGTVTDISRSTKFEGVPIISGPGFYIAHNGQGKSQSWSWSGGGRGGFVDVGKAGDNYENFNFMMYELGAGITHKISWDRIPDEVREKIEAGREVIVSVKAGEGADGSGELDIDRLFPVGDERIDWTGKLVSIEDDGLYIRLPVRFNFERVDQEYQDSAIITLQSASRIIWSQPGTEGNRIRQDWESMPIPLYGYGRVTVGIFDKSDTVVPLDSHHLNTCFYEKDRCIHDSVHAGPAENPEDPWWLGHLRMSEKKSEEDKDIPHVVFAPELFEGSGADRSTVHIFNNRGYTPSQITIGGENGGFFKMSSVGMGFIFPVEISFYLADTDNLSASAVTFVSSAKPGDEVNLEFNVRSTFQTDVEPSYEIKKNGKIVKSGRLFIPPAGGDYVLYTFPMAADDVIVEFTVNPGGDDPEETDLSDNTAEITISAANTLVNPGVITLEYNVLEQIESFNLGQMSASLTLPLYSNATWDGPAAITLTVTNETPGYYHDFSADGISGDSVTITAASTDESITLNPLIRTTIVRDLVNYGDDPLGGTYGANFMHRTRRPRETGVIKAEGTASRSFSYTVDEAVREYNEALKAYVITWETVPMSGTVSASFNSVENNRTIIVEVYNGSATLERPEFKDRIDGNTAISLSKHLWWESEKILLTVLRPMGDRKPYFVQRNPLPVTGQYGRVFTNQNEALAVWAVGTNHAGRSLGLAAEYKADRDNARARNYDVSSADKAVFASDTSFSGVPYPIRSGYFFNPAGTYTFTISTQIYSSEPYETEEHEQLVETITAAFRYESNMVYINPSRQAVTIGGAPASRTGTTYAATHGFATVASSPLFDIGVTKDHSLDSAEELQHNFTESGTDRRFKCVLEGYSESGTRDSMTDYKYIEFVDSYEKVYKVTETTTVRITVNPDNRRVYTHPQLRNGDYPVRVSFAGINLGTLDSLRYNNAIRAISLSGVGNLDSITVKVVGSMYDDAG